MTGRLLTDYGGAIEAIALCNPDGVANRALLRAHGNLLGQLPPDVAVTLLCRHRHAAGLARWLRRIGATNVGLAPVAAKLPSNAVWVQDHLLVKLDRARRTYMGVVSEHPCDTALWLGRAAGIPAHRSGLRLSAGNLLVGARYRILGAGAVEMAAGSLAPVPWRRALARLAAIDPRPLHLFGYGDAPDGPPLFQEPFHLDLALAPTGCCTEAGAPILLLAAPSSPLPELDEAAARLRQGGFHVIRNHVPPPAGGFIGYNNVLVENILRPGARRPLILLPRFGDRRPSLRRYDEYACRLWHALGFAPRPVAGWAPFIFAGGALRCAAKVLRRGSWPGPERVVSARTLRAVARLEP